MNIETIKNEIASINERLNNYLNFNSELTNEEAMLLTEERERLMNKLEVLEEEAVVTVAGDSLTITEGEDENGTIQGNEELNCEPKRGTLQEGQATLRSERHQD